MSCIVLLSANIVVPSSKQNNNKAVKLMVERMEKTWRRVGKAGIGHVTHPRTARV